MHLICSHFVIIKSSRSILLQPWDDVLLVKHFLHLENLAPSPYINHFLQPDTLIPDLSNPQSWNRYSYVTNRPVNFNDPTGHESGDCYDRGYCSRLDALQKKFDSFTAPMRVEKNDMRELGVVKLAPAEIALIAPLLAPDSKRFVEFTAIRFDAEETAKKHYSYPDGDPELFRDPGDAFRHAYWSARLFQRFGERFARAFTIAHETEYSSHIDASKDAFMDMQNNDVGFRIASANPDATRKELEGLIYDALTSGYLIIYDGKDLFYSDMCPLCNKVKK